MISHEQLFICGTHFSGMSRIGEILAAHPSIYHGPELSCLCDIASLHGQWTASTTAQNELKASGLSAAAVDESVAALVLRLIPPAAAATKHVWTHVSADNASHLLSWARIFPRARFLHVIRDPRNVVEDLVAANLIDRATGHLSQKCRDVKHAATYWCDTIRAIRCASNNQFLRGRVVEVRYEDLCGHPESVLRAILQFLGQPWSDQLLECATKLLTADDNQSRLPLRPGSRCVAWTPSDEDCFAAVAQALRVECGYGPQMTDVSLSSEQKSACEQLRETAIALHRGGKLKEAWSQYRRILGLSPRDPVTLHMAGLLAFQLGEKDAAIQLIVHAIQVSPDVADFHDDLGVVLHSLGRRDQALTCFHKALEITPDHRGALDNLAKLRQLAPHIGHV